MPQPVWTWPQATIVRVIDGDSIVAYLTRDIGFHGTVTFDQRLRLNRINAAPVKTDSGRSAAVFIHDQAAGALVTITTTAPYKYRDEWMAEVILPDGSNLSDLLVAHLLASYWDGTGPRPGG